jgi:multiple antibiotic resistance protein
MLHAFLETFIPLFVTIDAFGLVPIFLSVVGALPPQRRREITFQAVAASLVICLAFMLLGEQLFHFLRIEPYDFRVGGGILLLVLAVYDLLIVGKPAVNESETWGVVPLAMPLIAGPATLTTLLVLVQRHGPWLTALGLVTNLAMLLAVLLASTKLMRATGVGFLRAVSKLVMILLAAIAVNMIRSGVQEAVTAMRMSQ